MVKCIAIQNKWGLIYCPCWFWTKLSTHTDQFIEIAKHNRNNFLLYIGLMANYNFFRSYLHFQFELLWIYLNALLFLEKLLNVCGERTVFNNGGDLLLVLVFVEKVWVDVELCFY